MKNERIQIKATPNHSKKTFTIRYFDYGKCYLKFRTLRLNRQEFEDCEYFTQNDWKDWIKNNQWYYKVK